MGGTELGRVLLAPPGAICCSTDSWYFEGVKLKMLLLSPPVANAEIRDRLCSHTASETSLVPFDVLPLLE